eukprot:1090990-Karenia_brevis.AAC.1
MTARQERELFSKLCGALETKPPNCVRLQHIINQWSAYQFDTDFEEFRQATAALSEHALKSERVLELARQ